jgi:hypothetical protein
VRILRRFLRYTLALALVLVPTAQAGRNVIYGINDGSLAHSWEGPQLNPLGQIQVGVWLRYPCGALGSWFTRDLTDDLGQVPPWQPALVQLVGEPPCSPDTPEERHIYADHALELVHRYPNIRELQVWNEPDLGFWQGGTENYVLLLAVVHETLRGTGVKLLGPGLSPTGLLNGKVQMGTRSFARAVFDFYWQRPDYRQPLLDGFSYHPYWGFDRKTTKRTARTLNHWWHGLPQPSPKHGLRFWWTETGMWSSGSAWRKSMVGSPEDQAKRTTAVAREARRNPLVAADFNFLLRDENRCDRWQSGLYYIDGDPKPAFYAFQAAIRH